MGVAASLAIRLAHAQTDNRVLASDNRLQGQLIATQAFNFKRFNQAAEHASRLNSLIDASTKGTVIEYREILHREKTCGQPVPDDIAGRLLEHAHRLRTSPMYAHSGISDKTDDRTATASSMTHCQAGLWIKPLLAEIEKGNNNLTGIREITRVVSKL
ncbi:hypothetical protein ACX43S_25385 [Enterobacter cloacae]